MQTIGRTSIGTARKDDNRIDQAGDTIRCDKSRESYGANGCRNSFLKTPILPIAPQTIMRESYCGNSYNLITQENYEYLRDSYFRYAGLMNVKAEHTPGRSIGESISNLYHEMDAIKGDGINLNYEENGGRLYFNLWQTHTWGEYTLYYFPMRFVENLNSKLRRIVITFIHNLMKANGFSTINDEDDVDCIFEWISDPPEDEEPEERKKRERLIRSYKKGGKAYNLLDRVWRKSYYKNLPRAIEDYDCKNGFEQGLIELMRKGLEFITPNKSIMYYAYDPFYDEEPDVLPVGLEQQIRVVYDFDMLTDYLEDHLTQNLYNSYDIIPISTFEVTPHTEKPFSLEDTYPERFFKWADQFIYYIR